VKASPFRAEPVFRALAFVVSVAPLAISAVVESPVPLATRMEAGLCWMLCLFPGWLYLGQGVATRRPIPLIPLIGLLYGLYYALPPALGTYNQHYRIVLNPVRDYDDAVFTALLGWLALAAGYVLAKLFVRAERVTSAVEVSATKRQWYGLLLMTVGLLLELARRFAPIPSEIAGILVFVTSLGWFGSGLLIVLAVQKRLSLLPLIITYLGVAGFFLLALESGLLSGAAWYGTVVVVSGLIGHGRLKATWFLGIVAAVLLMFSLRGVTPEYRKIVWEQGEGGGLTDRMKLRVSLLKKRLASEGVAGTISTGFETTSERSANLDVLADVIMRTPNEVPYWGGETYLSLVGAFVPRFLWPDKPSKELGQGFGHRYNYLDSHDEATSFNFPILIEAYANFGIVGVAVVMWLCGCIYMLVERAVNVPGQGDLLSLAGVVLIIPLTNIESDFSLGFGGLIMNGAAMWIVLRAIRGKIPDPCWHPPIASPITQPMRVAPSDR
jgi:hypothetical protein